MTEDSYIDPDWIALQMHESNKLRLETIKELLAKRGIGVADHVHSSLTTIDMLLTFGPACQWPIRFEDDRRASRSVAILLRHLPNVVYVLLHHTNMKRKKIVLLPEHTLLYWSVRIGWDSTVANSNIKDPYGVIGGNKPRYDRPRYRLDPTTSSDTGLVYYPAGRGWSTS